MISGGGVRVDDSPGGRRRHPGGWCRAPLSGALPWPPLTAAPAPLPPHSPPRAAAAAAATVPYRARRAAPPVNGLMDGCAYNHSPRPPNNVSHRALRAAQQRRLHAARAVHLDIHRAAERGV
eukprot:COSAG01_NODE_169_length_23159_cov_44.920035_7_plen_122_part_00